MILDYLSTGFFFGAQSHLVALAGAVFMIGVTLAGIQP
jgi:hypothetical protein